MISVKVNHLIFVILSEANNYAISRPFLHRNNYLLRKSQLKQINFLEIYSTMPITTKVSTNIYNHFTNTINTWISSSKNVFNALQPSSRKEAICYSHQNIVKACWTIWNKNYACSISKLKFNFILILLTILYSWNISLSQIL